MAKIKTKHDILKITRDKQKWARYVIFNMMEKVFH